MAPHTAPHKQEHISPQAIRKYWPQHKDPGQYFQESRPLRYSSIVLVSCTSRIKYNIQVMQNTLLRVIRLPGALAEINHKIIDENYFILNSCLKQINRILSLPTHPLTVSLHSSTITHSPFPFTITRRNTESFKLNAVMIQLRDKIYGTGR